MLCGATLPCHATVAGAGRGDEERGSSSNKNLWTSADFDAAEAAAVMGGDVMLSATERRDSFANQPLERTLSKLASFKRQQSSGSALRAKVRDGTDRGEGRGEGSTELARGPSQLNDGALLQRQGSPGVPPGLPPGLLMRQGSMLTSSV